MARIQNEKHASEELNFRVQTVDGEIRNPTVQDEFWTVIKEFKIYLKGGLLTTPDLSDSGDSGATGNITGISNAHTLYFVRPYGWPVYL